ncbi:hypothetical protein HJFPF1_00414 [Paramyrothecium foliicola]|nr:hypothetical protein HJFPF1_00414 [Paramyrothecium foliicola]
MLPGPQWIGNGQRLDPLLAATRMLDDESLFGNPPLLQPTSLKAAPSGPWGGVFEMGTVTLQAAAAKRENMAFLGLQ